MAIILYSNGISEEYKPKNLVFNEEEILSIFSGFSKIKSIRIMNMVNTWCIYGEGNHDPEEFNEMGVVILQSETPIYSHLMFIHDSELNPEWKVTEDILQNSYDKFILELSNFINNSTDKLLNEMSSKYENKVESLPILSTVGITQDKKILFVYNPDEQSETFYKNEEFYKFSQKVYNYIINNKQDKEPFKIYEDKKAIIIIESGKVKIFFESILQKFQSKEEYEICTNISKMIKDWSDKDNKVIKKRTRRKINPSGNANDEQ